MAVFEGVPRFEVAKSVLDEGVKAVDLFVDNAAVFASKGEMRKLVQGGGVSLNKEKLSAFDQVITSADVITSYSIHYTKLYDREVWSENRLPPVH